MTTEERERVLLHMAEAGKQLAERWGHEPWTDSWAREVALAMLNSFLEIVIKP